MKRTFFVLISLIIINTLAFSESDEDKRSNETEMIFAEAVQLSSEGKYDEAIKKYQYLISHQVKDKYVYYSLLEAYTSKIGTLSSGNNLVKDLYKDEMNYIKEAISIYTNDKKILYYYTDSARNQGLVVEYVNALQKILEIDEMDIFANYYLGDYYYVNKRYGQAAYYLQKVIAAPITNKEFELMAAYRAYYTLGIIALMEQDFQYAIQYLEKAKDIYSKDYDLIKAIAFTYANILEYDKAIENFELIPDFYRSEDVIDLYGGVLFMKKSAELTNIINENKDRSAFLQSIDYYLKKEYDNSVKELDRSIAEKKVVDFYSLYLYYLNYEAIGDHIKATQQAFFIGNKAKEAGRIDMAIQYFKILQDNTNSIPSVYWLIGSLYDDKNDYTNAIIFYNKYLQHPASDEFKIQALIRISDMYYRINNMEMAGQMLKKAKEDAGKKSDLFQVYFYSGLIHFENKRYTEAIRDFEEALKADGKEAKLYFFLGTSYFEMKNTKKAMEYLENGIKYDEHSAEMNNLLAYIYAIEKTKLDEALRLVNLSLLSHPENFAYLDTLGWIYFQKEDYNKSFEIFNQILYQISQERSQEGLDEIYYHIGMIYEKMGNKEEAKKFYSKGYDINPKNDLLIIKIKTN